MTNEFSHYPGCRLKDPDNCSGCALTTLVDIDGKPGINYAGWPLSYMENGRAIPVWAKELFLRELARTDNMLYVENLKQTVAKHGLRAQDQSTFLLSIMKWSR